MADDEDPNFSGSNEGKDVPCPRDGTVSQWYHELVGVWSPTLGVPTTSPTMITTTPAVPTRVPSAAHSHRNFSHPFSPSVTAPILIRDTATIGGPSQETTATSRVSEIQDTEILPPVEQKKKHRHRAKSLLKSVSGVIGHVFRRIDSKAAGCTHPSTAPGAPPTSINPPVLPLLRRVNEGNNLISSDKARAMTGTRNDIVRRPLPETRTAPVVFSQPGQASAATMPVRAPSLDKSAKESQDPFVAHGIMHHDVDEPLDTTPPNASTPRPVVDKGKGKATEPPSPQSPTNNVRAARRLFGGIPKLRRNWSSYSEASADAEEDQNDGLRRKRGKHIAPSLSELATLSNNVGLMTEQEDMLRALIDSEPKPGEPTNEQERFDWAFEQLKNKLSENETASPIEMARAAAPEKQAAEDSMVTEDPIASETVHPACPSLGKKGKLKIIRYHPAPGYDFARKDPHDDLNDPENCL